MENKIENSLAHAIRTLNNLDAYSERSGSRYVHFYANVENQKAKRDTITLTIEDGFIQVAVSMCLPLNINGWREHAAAYRRAEEFLRLSEMSDSRPTEAV
jgi:hypothetical protein